MLAETAQGEFGIVRWLGESAPQHGQLASVAVKSAA
jgi:hypothetical protein